MTCSDTVRHSTHAFVLLAAALAVGCSSSHGPGEPDGSPGDATPDSDPPRYDCFVAGTPIDTPKGPVPIEQLELGDDVYAFDEGRQRLAVAKVVHKYRRDERAVRELTLKDGRTLHVSSTHPFYDAETGEYVEVGELKPGTSLLERDPKHGLSTLAVRSVDDGPRRTTIYNIEVSTHHNYFAGGVLVHNKSRAACLGGPCCMETAAPIGDACPDGYSYACTPDPVACPRCADNSECELALDRCCGPCGEPTLDDFDAINGEYREEHREAVCPEPEPCPECASQPNPALGATCEDSLCRGFDVRTMDLSACTADDDCRLRVTECCECGGDTSPASLIAIRADANAEYQSLVCDVETGCAGCAPVYPTDEVEAHCADDGHCDVRRLDGGGG